MRPGNAAGDRNRAVIERLQPGKYLEQRRFAGAVGPDKPNAVLGRNEPIEVFEQELVAVSLARAGELNH